jgi:hypothetical protein
MYGRHELVPFSTWYHRGSNSFYTVIGIALCSTNGPDEHKAEAVVYVSHTHQGLRYREIKEFLSGRFVPQRLAPKIALPPPFVSEIS